MKKKYGYIVIISLLLITVLSIVVLNHFPSNLTSEEVIEKTYDLANIYCDQNHRCIAYSFEESQDSDPQIIVTDHFNIRSLGNEEGKRIDFKFEKDGKYIGRLLVSDNGGSIKFVEIEGEFFKERIGE
ncbi:hypothetical protein [Bacillus fonticola]|uniref:hypothetical protein n=1 Tax=Bacillus fonticola TaxID=2728853 RepID=UPI0014740FA7|nr:hypothetical protein [Bacillus fonticola]